MKPSLLLAAALALSSNVASAALYHFEGNLTHHNQVVVSTFTLTQDATNIRVWTDSFKSGLNFDPISALWNASTGALIDQNDDNESVNPDTQTYYDSGFSVASLEAGTYFFTVAAFDNFASTQNFYDGFEFSQQTPIPLADWCQPSTGCNPGSAWSVWLDGVDIASNPSDVPEPGSLALLGLGALGLARARRRSVK